MSSLAGVLATACGPSVEPEVEDDPVSPPLGSGDAATDTSSTSTSGATSASATHGPATSDGDETSPQRFDVGGPPDFPEVDCPAQPMPPREGCTAELPPDAYFVFYCVDAPENGSCETWAEEFPEQTWAIDACLMADPCGGIDVNSIGCGPLPDSGDQCCFWLIAEDGSLCPGRPFVVAGRERLAELSERDDWVTHGSAPTPDASPERAAIAAAWAEQALFEHASIASFSRFVLQLLSCGAPASLLTAAHVALGEEIEHARLFFAFASRYAGRAVGPAALATHDALTASHDFDEIVLSTVREGCIAETISAWHVALVAQSARDPAMAAALARVAEQELEHAALAWRFLAWALPRASDSLQRRIDATFRTAARFVPRGPTLASTVAADHWRAHGILPARDHAAATAQALRELVAPLARSLCSGVAAHDVAGLLDQPFV